MIAVGDPLPDIPLGGADGPVELRALANGGEPLLILFYQEDATPACTAQLCAFRDDFELVGELGAKIIAISSDDAESHQRFSNAHALPFPLFSDENLAAATAFGVVDDDGKRARRAAFVAIGGVVTLAIPFYQPSHLEHYMSVFGALGAEGAA